VSRARRAALAAGVLGSAALVTWSGWIEPRRLAVRELELDLPHWPAALDGLRAGVLSDLHAGVPHAGLGAIRRAVDTLNAAAPDVHLLLGDYLDASQVLRRRLRPEVVAEALARLEAPLGTVAVLGNHDWRNSGDRMWRALSQVGITVLEDGAVPLAAPGGELWVAGLGDLRHRAPDVRAALEPVPEGAPVLVLSHDPDLFPQRRALRPRADRGGGPPAARHQRDRHQRPARPAARAARGAGAHASERSTPSSVRIRRRMASEDAYVESIPK
jgi:predicted MPP superfamily phosphohydrolase